MSITHQSLDILRTIFRDFNTKELISLRQISKAWKDMIERSIDSHPIYCNNKFCDDYCYILRNAKVINMRHCRLITGKGLAQLNKVEVLNLSGCYKIRDEDLEHLTHIQEINLAGCYQITDNGVQHLMNARYVDVSYCSQIITTSKSVIKEYHAILKNKTKKNQTIKFKTDDELRHLYLTKYRSQRKIVALTPEQSQTIDDYRCNLFDQIYSQTSISERDQIFLKDYRNLMPHNDLNDYSEAINRLYQNSQMQKFIKKISQTDLDALIGGSTGLACIYRKATFMPNDIDLYIKELDREKLIIVEDIIYQTFEIKNLVVVRNPITITWYIQQHDDTILTIQVNLFKITSWAEVFITYHTDLTCVGYEVKSENFVYLVGRWEKTLTNDNHCFSNILNFDNSLGLENAAIKYQSRGFNCSISKTHMLAYRDNYPNIISNLMQKLYNIETCEVSNSTLLITNIAENFLPHILCKYRDIKDKLLFGSTANNVFGDEIPIPIKYLSIFKVDPTEDLTNVRNYFNCDRIQLSYGQLCQSSSKLFTVGIKCPTCDYCVSLARYVRQSRYKGQKKLCSHLADHLYFYSRRVDYKFVPKLVII